MTFDINAHEFVNFPDARTAMAMLRLIYGINEHISYLVILGHSKFRIVVNLINIFVASLIVQRFLQSMLPCAADEVDAVGFSMVFYDLKPMKTSYDSYHCCLL